MTHLGAWVGFAAAVALTACRLGGPSADPNAYVTFPGDAAASDGSLDVAVPLPPPGDDASIDGARLDEQGDGANASDGPDDASSDGGGSATDGRTCGGSIAVCDPIHDTGCNPFQQCDVDLTRSTTATGVCVFNSPQPEGGACSTSAFSETCPPRSTCVKSACRVLCACDVDCPAGQCCSDTSGPPGFALCQPCP